MVSRGSQSSCNLWAQLRLPAHTQFVTYMDGQIIAEESIGDIFYDMTPRTLIFSKAYSIRMSLGTLIKDYHPTVREVWGYQPFSPGVPPPVLKRSTKADKYVTGNRVSAAVIAAAQESKSWHLRLGDGLCAGCLSVCLFVSLRVWAHVSIWVG